MSKHCFYLIVVLCLICLTSGCTEVKEKAAQVKVVEPTLTSTPSPTATPGPRDTGEGELEFNYLHIIEAGRFETRGRIPFTIKWNEEKKLWEAIAEQAVAQGNALINSSGMQCNGSYIADIFGNSGIVVPPVPLKLLGDCKLQFSFRNQYDAFQWTCSNGVSFMNDPTSSIVGPILFDLRIGDRQAAYGDPQDKWSSTYEFVITKLSLPSVYLAPFCDTSGRLDSRTVEPPNPIDKILTPQQK